MTDLEYLHALIARVEDLHRRPNFTLVGGALVSADDNRRNRGRYVLMLIVGLLASATAVLWISLVNV
jgi:hypothetical protein